MHAAGLFSAARGLRSDARDTGNRSQRHGALLANADFHPVIRPTHADVYTGATVRDEASLSSPTGPAHSPGRFYRHGMKRIEVPDVNLGDLVRAGDLGISILVPAIDALERPILGSQITDLPDPSRYLSEGDLVLTNALWASTPGGASSFVSAASESKASAVVIGLVDGGAVPDEVIRLCRQFGMTLATVGEDISLTVVAERISALQPEGSSIRLARGQDFSRRLLEVESERGGPGGVLDVFTEASGIVAWLMSDVGALVAAVGTWPSPERVASTWNARPTEPGPEPARLRRADGATSSVWAVSSHSRIVAGYLVVEREFAELSPDTLVQVDAVVTALRLDLELAVRRRDAADASVAELMHALGDESVSVGEVSARLRLIGLDPQQPLVVVTASVADPEFPPEATLMIVEAITEAAQASERGCIDGESIVLFVNQPQTQPEQSFEHAAEPWLPFLAGRQLRVGISDPVASIEQLSSALAVARERLVATTGDASVVVTRTSNARSHRALLALLGDRTRASFGADVLGPLVDYDERNGSELVATLRAFLDNGGAWVQTARDLELHPNTMRYRMSRVEDLTGRDLSRMSDRVDLFLAFASLDL
jgi:hypothetical protein